MFIANPNAKSAIRPCRLCCSTHYHSAPHTTLDKAAAPINMFVGPVKFPLLQQSLHDIHQTLVLGKNHHTHTIAPLPPSARPAPLLSGYLYHFLCRCPSSSSLTKGHRLRVEVRLSLSLPHYLSLFLLLLFLNEEHRLRLKAHSL